MFWRKIFFLCLVLSLLVMELPEVSVQSQEGIAIPPQVIDVYPHPDSTMYSAEPLTITFNQPMDQGSVEKAISITPTLEGTWHWEDRRTLRFIPAWHWASSPYMLNIDKSARSSEWVTLARSYQAEFLGIAALTFTELPASGAQDIPLDSVISVNFNQPMVTENAVGHADTLGAPFRVEPRTAGSGMWLNTSLYVFTPDEPLRYGHLYTVHLESNFPLPNGQNLSVINPQRLSWTFRTLTPQAMSITPGYNPEATTPGATNIKLDTPIQVNFNVPMEQTTTEQAFSLNLVDYRVDGTYTPISRVAGDFIWNAESTAFTFIPDEWLNFLAQDPERPHTNFYNYMVVIANTAQTLDGYPLPSGLRGFFSTTRRPEFLGIAPINQADQREGVWLAGMYPILKFSTPMDIASLKEHITINPAPPQWELLPSGEPEHIYLVFNPASQTEYTIMIDEDAHDMYGNTLGKSASAGFKSGVTGGSLSVFPDSWLFRPFAVVDANHTDTVFPLLATGVVQAKVSLYQLEPYQFIANSYEGSRNIEVPDDNQRLRQWFQTIGNPYAMREPYNLQLASLKGGRLPMGLYGLFIHRTELDLTGKESLAYGVAVANVEVNLKRTTDEMLVWITDFATGLPVANLPITIYHENEVLLTGKSDAEGIWRFPVDLYHDMDSPFRRDSQIIVVAQDADHFGVWYTLGDPTAETEQIYFTTDRASYQPGDTVHFKGTVRLVADTHTSIPVGAHVRVHSNSANTTVFDKTFTLNRYGSFSGSFVLSENTPLHSSFYVGVVYEKYYTEFSYTYAEHYNVYLSVTDFRPGNTRITVTSPTTELMAGDPLQTAVTAQNYWGEPLANLNAYLKLSAEPQKFEYTADPRYSFFDTTAKLRQSPAVPVGFTGKTDAEGRYGLTTLPLDFQTRQLMRVTIEGGVNVHSNIASTTTQQVLLHPAHVYVGLKGSNAYTLVNEPVTLDILTIDPTQALVPHQEVTLEIEQKEWQSAYYPYYNGRLAMRPAESYRLQDTFTVTTDAQGHLQIPLTFASRGTYHVRAIVEDENGRQNSSIWAFDVVDDALGYSDSSLQKNLQIYTDKTSYAPGDVAQVSVLLPFAIDGSALMTTERQHLHDYEVRRVQGGRVVYEIPITAEDAPYIIFQFKALTRPTTDYPYPQVLAIETTLFIDDPAQQLDVEVTPSINYIGEQSEVTLQIDVRDGTGQPQAAELEIRIADKAVFQTLPDQRSDFMRRYRYNAPTLYWGVISTYTLTYLLDHYTDVPLPNPYNYGSSPRPNNGWASPYQVVPQLLSDERQASIAVWEPMVYTDKNGQATLTFPMPNQAGEWLVMVKAITRDTKIGETTVTFTTQTADAPLSTITPMPSSLVAGDHVQFATQLSNNSATAQTVLMHFTGQGLTLENDAWQAVNLAPHSTAQITWWATVQNASSATIQLERQIITNSSTSLPPPDVQTVHIPILAVPAVAETIAGGSLRGAEQALTDISLPYRWQADGEWVIQTDANLVKLLRTALATQETTLPQSNEEKASRFMGRIILYRTLATLGVRDSGLRFELLTAFNDVYPNLYLTQNVDGGWSWTDGNGVSDPLTTAYILLALSEARGFGLFVDGNATARAITYLQAQVSPLTEIPNLDTATLNRQVFLYSVLVKFKNDLWSNLDHFYNERARLSYQSKALMMLAYMDANSGSFIIAEFGRELQAEFSTSADGLYWNDSTDGFSWTTDVGTTALALHALIRWEGKKDFMPDVVAWLLAQSWQTSLESAWVLQGLASWLRVSEGVNHTIDTTLYLNQTPLAEREVARGEIFRIPFNQALRSDLNVLSVKHNDEAGRVYYRVTLQQTPQSPTDLEAVSRGISVQRAYFLAEVPNAEAFTGCQRGDIINVRLIFTLSEPLDYFMLEDTLPGGLTLVANPTLTAPATLTPNGNEWFWGKWWFNKIEWRTDGFNLYANHLPAGTYSYTYQAQATLVGEYHALPAHATAAYTPELFGQTATQVFKVNE